MDKVFNKYLIGIFLVLLLFALLIYGHYVYKKINIQANSIYVIAKIYKVDDTADALSYKFWYNYNGKKYYSSITAVGLGMQKRLILLQISSEKPDLWFYYENMLPQCIVKNPNFEKAWDSIPTCDK